MAQSLADSLDNESPGMEKDWQAAEGDGVHQADLRKYLFK
jgi:hypothetical protein